MMPLFLTLFNMLNTENLTYIQQRITEYIPDSQQILFVGNQFLEQPENTKCVIVLSAILLIALTLWTLWRLLITVAKIVLHVAPYALVAAFWISMDPTHVDKILILIVSFYCFVNLPILVSSFLFSVAAVLTHWEEYGIAMFYGWVAGLVWFTLSRITTPVMPPPQQPFAINPPMMVRSRNGGTPYYVRAGDVISSKDGRPQHYVRTVDSVYHRVVH